MKKMFKSQNFKTFYSVSDRAVYMILHNNSFPIHPAVTSKTFPKKHKRQCMAFELYEVSSGKEIYSNESRARMSRIETTRARGCYGLLCCHFRLIREFLKNTNKILNCVRLRFQCFKLYAVGNSKNVRLLTETFITSHCKASLIFIMDRSE